MKERTEGTLVFSFLFLLFYFFTKDTNFILVATLILFLALLSQQADLLFDKLFHTIIRFLSKINSVIILSLIYAILLTPISLIYKLFNRKNPKDSDKSFYDYNSIEFSMEQFKNPW